MKTKFYLLCHLLAATVLTAAIVPLYIYEDIYSHLASTMAVTYFVMTLLNFAFFYRELELPYTHHKVFNAHVLELIYMTCALTTFAYFNLFWFRYGTRLTITVVIGLYCIFTIIQIVRNMLRIGTVSPCPYPTSVKVISSVTLGLLVLFSIWMFHLSAHVFSTTSKITTLLAALVMLLTPLITCALMPLRVYVTETGILLQLLLGIKFIPRDEIVKIEPFPKDSTTIRLFGSGGLMGFIGIFSNSVIGNFTAFATDIEHASIIYRKGKRPFVLSVADPNILTLYKQHPDTQQDKQQQMAQIDNRCNMLRKSSNFAGDLCWSDFDKMCSIVNQQFYLLATKLKGTNLLNETEIRLCVLVLIGLTRQEMSTTLPYALSSVGKLKDNTAKKLGTTGKNLREHLINIICYE